MLWNLMLLLLRLLLPGHSSTDALLLLHRLLLLNVCFHGQISQVSLSLARKKKRSERRPRTHTPPTARRTELAMPPSQPPLLPGPEALPPP